jgi:ribosomal protein S18 acetylase RimI-like enzyme
VRRSLLQYGALAGAVERPRARNASLRAIMSTLHTRLATLDDLDAVASLFDDYRQFYEQAPDAALARRFIQDRMTRHESVILLALDDTQQVIGFCQLYPSFCSVEATPIYVLYDLFVAPAARRSGAGRLLLQAAEQHAREQGRTRMDLTTARTNAPAQAAYESLGWVRDEVFLAYSKQVAADPQGRTAAE